MRAHKQGSEPIMYLGSAAAKQQMDFSEKAKRRQSVPQAILEKDLADFDAKRKGRSHSTFRPISYQ